MVSGAFALTTSPPDHLRQQKDSNKSLTDIPVAFATPILVKTGSKKVKKRGKVTNAGGIMGGFGTAAPISGETPDQPRQQQQQLTSTTPPASPPDAESSSVRAIAADPVEIEVEIEEEIDLPHARPKQGKTSGRKRNSRFVEIDGHLVAKENNYTVVGGSYVYHNDGNEVDGDIPGSVGMVNKNKKVVVKSATARPLTEKQILIRQERAEERAGATALHDLMKEHKQNQSSLMRNYFSAHVDDGIRPFIDPMLAESLEQHKGKLVPVKDLQLQPFEIEADLRDYQLDGLNWMRRQYHNGCPMILGDEMGLGKTLQTISLLAHLKETVQGGTRWPSLIICPLSVLNSWCNEFKKWAPNMKILRMHDSDVAGREQVAKEIRKDPRKYDAIITTYEMVKNPSLKSLFQRVYWHMVVLDEGHIIKCESTLISEAVRRLHYVSTLILTGTPLQNNLHELWALLNYLCPDYFVESEPFDDAFDIGNQICDDSVLGHAHKLLKIFMLRRLKVEVEKLMPKKVEIQVKCPLSILQQNLYKAIILKEIDVLESIEDAVKENTPNPNPNPAVEQKSTKRLRDGQVFSEDEDEDAPLPMKKYSVLNNLVMQLRKVCNHPYLIKGTEGDPDETLLDDLVGASGKLAVLDKVLRDLFVNGHRVCVFSQFTTVLDLIEDYCRMRGWVYTRLDGGTSRVARSVHVNEFNSPQSNTFIFLMTTRAGGMGLNLQSADTCILFDSDWNPQPDLQAQARVHRIGQTKLVHVYRLVAEGTIEERIVERAQKKLYLDQAVNTGSNSSAGGAATTRVGASELMKSIKFGSDAILGNKSNELPTDKAISLLCDREATRPTPSAASGGGSTDTDADTRSKKHSVLQETNLNTATFDATTQMTKTTQLKGVDFGQLREKLKKDRYKHMNEVNVVNDGLKRKRSSTLVKVNFKGSAGDQWIKKSNNYDLETGEGSVFSELKRGEREKAAVPEKKKREKLDFASTSRCHACGGSGTLICCDKCPASYHPECMGYSADMSDVPNVFVCPQHKCIGCLRSASSAGGCLFVCQSCTGSFCDDCCPEGATHIGRNDLFEKLGFPHHSLATYIHCSDGCVKFARKNLGWRGRPRAPPLPPPLDNLESNFGLEIEKDNSLETAIENKMKERVRLKKRLKV